MKYIVICTLALSLFTQVVCAQNAADSYDKYKAEADSLLSLTQYTKAANAYSAAFKSIGWRGYNEDRYNAARAWAMSGVPDSAFFNLLRITEKADFDELDRVNSEADFQSLHKDARWAELCTKIKANMPSMPELAVELNKIHNLDQKYRLMLDEVSKKYGHDSKEMTAVWDTIRYYDDINLRRVRQILDTKGWLGPKEVGATGNSTLFLVIQHSNLPVQMKYLPMMREAVKAEKAKGSSLALLEDRVALGQGKKQMYGSQIGMDRATGKYHIQPINDPKNVDKRRAEVGLGPLSEYVSNWDLIWNEAEAEKMEKGN
jgi:hypothetical protein